MIGTLEPSVNELYGLQVIGIDVFSQLVCWNEDPNDVLSYSITYVSRVVSQIGKW